MLKIFPFLVIIVYYCDASHPPLSSSSWSISIPLSNGSRQLIDVPLLISFSKDDFSSSCKNCFYARMLNAGRRMIVEPCGEPNCVALVNSTGFVVNQPTRKYNLKKCGRINRKSYSSIHDGIKLKVSTSDENTLRPAEYPWLVRIESRSDIFSRTVTLCAGTLIHPQWIITAAHCMFDSKRSTLYPTHGITLFMGHYSRITTSRNEHVVKPVLYVINPKFRITLKSPAPIHDLALIKLASPVPLSRSICIACLPERTDKLPDGKLAFTAGWGHASPNSTAVNEPRKARIKISPRSCRKLMIDPSVHICGRNDRGSNICSGDSGAGLMVHAGVIKNKNKTLWKWYVFGVASFGLDECSQSVNHDNAFASISTDIDWIHEVIEKY